MGPKCVPPRTHRLLGKRFALHASGRIGVGLVIALIPALAALLISSGCFASLLSAHRAAGGP
jgi:hypothetical protein